MKSKAIGLALLALTFEAQAATVSDAEAKLAACAWGQGRVRLGVNIGASYKGIETLETTDKTAKFYAVKLEGGTVFISGDTQIEPVLAFSSESEPIDRNSPLWQLLDRDVSSRQAAVERAKLTAASANGGAGETEAERKWAKLLGAAKLAAPNPVKSEFSLDDQRVSPIVGTKWGQSTVSGGSAKCFNYYTPEYTYADGAKAGRTDRCVCGCVATAMAQLLRYWSAPAGSRAAFSETCSQPATVKWSKEYGTYVSTSKSVKLTAEAGAYDWKNMIASPGVNATETQRRAIGKLTYDCGISVGMEYGITEEGGSGISSLYSYRISNAFVNRFGYANAAIVSSFKGVGASDRIRAILSNLDAKSPVLLCITGPLGGHAVVADGYGFSYGHTQYVHLNMGWQGQNDVWYNLPQINVSDNPENFNGFDTVNDVIYNVFPKEKGEIVSGRALRVVEGVTNGVEGATVTIRAVGDETVLATVTTDARGIYAFTVPAGQAYEISSAFDKYISLPKRTATLVDSTKGSATVGNSWGNDLVLENPSVKIGDRVFGSLDVALAAAKDGDTLEVIAPTDLDTTQTIGFGCTIFSADPAVGTIRRNGGARLEVAAGGTLALANVAFTGSSETLVNVAEGGVLKVGEGVGFGVPDTAVAVVTAKPEGLVFMGLLTTPIAVECTDSMALNQPFGYADGVDYLTASNLASKVTNLRDEKKEMAGFAEAAESAPYRLVWQIVPVALEDAAAYYVCTIDGAVQTNCFRSLDRAFEHFETMVDQGGEVTFVLQKDDTLSRAVTVKGDMTLISENGSGLNDLAVAAGFKVGAGAKLTVRGVAFDGMAKGLRDSLFIVDGGDLELCGGTAIRNFKGEKSTTSAVIRAINGATVTLGSEDGEVTIADCRNWYSNTSKGGALYLAGSTARLQGAVSITGCRCRGLGGGVYVKSGAQLNLSGMLRVCDNTSGDPAIASDIYCLPVDGVVVEGALDEGGSIGIRRNDKGWDAPGFAFARLEIGGSDAARAAKAFFCDGNDAVKAAAEGDRLCWAEDLGDIEPVDPSEAQAHVLDASGAEVGYYGSLADALVVMGGSGTIELMADVTIASNVVISGEVTLKSIEGGVFTVSRKPDCAFLVDADGRLTIENLTISGADQPVSLLQVDAGELILGGGAEVRDFKGSETSSESAISVRNGGRLVMKDGSRISNCENPYFTSYSNNGRGGAINSGSSCTIRIEGGTIENCKANLGAGVCIGNLSTIEVGGATEIISNGTVEGAPNNVYVPAYNELLLISPLTGKIGFTPGKSADPFIFGRVAAEFSGTKAQIANSAHNFTNDQTGDIGIAVSNGSETLLVWSDGLDAAGKYTDAEGNVYSSVSGGDKLKVPVPAVAEGLVYNGEEQAGVAQGHGFIVTEGSAVGAGEYTAVATPKANFVWDDGTTVTKRFPWSIAKADYDMEGIDLKDTTYTYDGKPKSIEVSGTLPKGVTVTYEGNGKIPVGTYPVTATFSGDADNYNPIELELAATLTINKAVYNMRGVIFRNATFTYDGEGKSAEIRGTLPRGLAVEYEGNNQTNAGVYTVTAKFVGDPDNYELVDPIVVTLTIKKATYDMSDVTFEDATFTYDGEAKSIEIQGTLPEGVTVAYEGNGQTEVGVYTVTAKFKGEDELNHELIDDMTATLTIQGEEPPPPPPPPPPTAVTNYPTPVAFQSIERLGAGQWKLVVTNGVQDCWYSLWGGTVLSIDDFQLIDGTRRQQDAAGPVIFEVTVPETDGAWFWKAVAEPGEQRQHD